MQYVKVYIGENEYNCKVAKSEEDKKQGLMGVSELKKDEGMLFVWDKAQDVSMWMKDTPIALDQIAINNSDEVTIVYKAKPYSTDSVIFPNTKYVLEVNTNSGIKVGDDFYIDDLKEPLPKMRILAPDGSTLMELEGGERIVSRRETKILIKKAKKAYLSKDDKDYKALGRYIFKVFTKQDNREPEYVESPNNE